MELVVYVGTDKETWGQLTGLMNNGTWEKIVVVKNKLVQGFPIPEKAEEISVDASLPLLELKEKMAGELKPLLSEFEACISLASGTGKEHMALISSLLSLPSGIRLVAFTKKGVEFIN